MTPFPYQQKGAEWLAARDRALLADQMGLGKTIQAIMAMDRAEVATAVIICPPVVRPHWERELRAVQEIGRAIVRVEGQADRVRIANADVVIVGWAQLLQPEVMRELLAREWDAVICDEAHAAKNPRAKRTRVLFGKACDGKGGLVEKAKRVWLLSGTPAQAGPHELWPALRALWPNLFGKPVSYDQWMTWSCRLRHTDYGPQVLGINPVNADALRAGLKKVMLRRKKADVLPELPPLRLAGVPLQLRALAISEIDAEVRKLDPASRTALLTGDLAEAEGANLASLSSLRRLLGVAKARPAAELIATDLEESNAKAIVFFQHRAVGDILREALHELQPVLIDGSTSAVARQAAIDSFQQDPGTRVFLGQIDACNSGITLTAASDVYLVEPAWTPAVNAQAIQRAHRIGQTSRVLARFLHAEDTVDVFVTAALKRKMETLWEIGLADD